MPADASGLRAGWKPGAFEAADKLLASPDFVRLARAATPAERDVAARQFAHSRAFARFMRMLGSPHVMTDRERWVLQAVQATRESGPPTR